MIKLLPSSIGVDTSFLPSPTPGGEVVCQRGTTIDRHGTTDGTAHSLHLYSAVPVQPDKVDVIVEVKAKADVRKVEVNV